MISLRDKPCPLPPHLLRQADLQLPARVLSLFHLTVGEAALVSPPHTHTSALLPFSLPLHNPLNKYPTSLFMVCLSVCLLPTPATRFAAGDATGTIHLRRPVAWSHARTGCSWDPLPTACCSQGTHSKLLRDLQQFLFFHYRGSRTKSSKSSSTT